VHTHELALFTRIQEALAANRHLRDVELAPLDEKQLSSYQMLTRKPVLVVLNAEDDQAMELPPYPHARSAIIALQGRLEMEIAQLPPDEAAEFLREYGIEEPSLNRVIRLSYDLLGLQSFFTVGEDEVRAWTVRRGATAPEAAGEVHTDMQKGFIRAEVASYDDLVSLGGYAEVKARGRLRLEGKDYLVRDGDILSIRFSPPAK
jgi:ribosome-binding ATPase YchF (GTP1/OBG family)